MTTSTHSHGLSASRQIGYFCIGVFFTLFGLGFAVAAFPDIISGKEDIIFIFGSFILVFSALPSGMLFFMMSVFTKVVITSNLLEYHTPTLIVSVKWQDIKRFEQQKSSLNYSVIVPTIGIVTFRTWAKIVPFLFRKDATTFYIDTSHFRNVNGHSLESDVVAFLSLAK